MMCGSIVLAMSPEWYELLVRFLKGTTLYKGNYTGKYRPAFPGHVVKSSHP